MEFSGLTRQEAVELFRDWATAYYTGKPKATDHEFDQLEAHIRTTWPDETVPFAVGKGYEVDGIKRSHKVPTESLPKIKENDFVNSKPANFRVTPKYDGISVVMYYENGRIVDALTRGGGEGTGKPILHNLIGYLQKTGLDKVDSTIMAISGEAIVSISDFEAYLSSDYELPRSAAAGITQTQSRHDKREYLRVEPFRLHFTDGRSLGIANEKDEAEFKKHVPFARAHAVADPTTLKAWIHGLGLPTDGAVLWDKVALKFETEKVETRVLGIRRQVSRLGKLIPVLEVEPRRVYGTTVQNVTMVNEGWVKAHGVGPGAVILMTKANEIIPQYLETLTTVPYTEPTQCPECGGLVELKGDHLYCVQNCGLKEYRPRGFIWTYASLLGYADSVLTKIFEINKIETVDDLLDKIGDLKWYGLTQHESVFLHHVNKTFSNPLPIESLLTSLNLPGVGESWSVKLAPFIKSWIIDGGSRPRGMTINTNVEDSILLNRDLITKVYNKFQWYKKADVIHSGRSLMEVTITGKLPSGKKKDDFCKEFDLVQADIKKSMILICADPNSNSSKMQAAKKLGAAVMSEDEFVAQYGRR